MIFELSSCVVVVVTKFERVYKNVESFVLRVAGCIHPVPGLTTNSFF